MGEFDDIIRFRCPRKLVARLERLAKLHRRDSADLYRIIMEDYCDAEEKTLQLPPLAIYPPDQRAAALNEEPPAAPVKPAKKLADGKRAARQ